LEKYDDIFIFLEEVEGKIEELREYENSLHTM
jgi:ketosteroid isomerase-like protein